VCLGVFGSTSVLATASELALLLQNELDRIVVGGSPGISLDFDLVGLGGSKLRGGAEISTRVEVVIST